MDSYLSSIFSAVIDFRSILIHPISKLLWKNRIQILSYHRICQLPQAEDITSSPSVPPVTFDKQMAFLSSNGFNVITIEQLVDYKERNIQPPPKTVIITFDDGYRDNYLNALPILEKYGFKGSLFVVTDYIGSNKIFPWLEFGRKALTHSRQNRRYWLPLSREEIAEMSAHGACFGSHTKTHPYLTDLDESSAMEELVGSRECLEEMLQKPVRCFCYPFGDVNKMVRQWTEAAGYCAALTTIEEGSNTLKSDFLKLKRRQINPQDSLAKFVRKVEGAYDLTVWWLPPIRFVRRLIFGKQGGR